MKKAKSSFLSQVPRSSLEPLFDPSTLNQTGADLPHISSWTEAHTHTHTRERTHLTQHFPVIALSPSLRSHSPNAHTHRNMEGIGGSAHIQRHHAGCNDRPAHGSAFNQSPASTPSLPVPKPRSLPSRPSPTCIYTPRPRHPPIKAFLLIVSPD